MRKKKSSLCFYIFILFLITIMFRTTMYAQWVKSNGDVSFKNVFSVAVSGMNVFAGTSTDGVFLSTDGGENFTEANTGLTNGFIPSVVISDNNIFAGTYGNGVFISTDNGANWSDTNTDGLDTTAVWIFTVAGNNIFAGTDADGIYLTANNGSKWSVVNNGLGTKFIRSLAALGTSIFAGTFGGGIFVSSDNGANWNESNTGLPGSAVVNCLAVSGSNIFAGTGAGTSNNIMYMSTNNGVNWEEASTGLSAGTNITSIAVSGSNIFASTGGDGVFLSKDNGANWNEVNEGLTSLFVHALAISDDYLFAGTVSGVWRRALSEITDVESDLDERISEFKLEQNYPNPFNPTTNFEFRIAEFGFVSLKVYDVLGKEIATLENEEKQPGVYKVIFDANTLSSGIYYYRLKAGNYIETKKMILLK